MSNTITITMPAASLRRARTSFDAAPMAVATAGVIRGHRGTGMPVADTARAVAARTTLPTTVLQIPTFGKGLAVAARDGNPGLRTRRRPPA